MREKLSYLLTRLRTSKVGAVLLWVTGFFLLWLIGSLPLKVPQFWLDGVLSSGHVVEVERKVETAATHRGIKKWYGYEVTYTYLLEGTTYTGYGSTLPNDDTIAIEYLRSNPSQSRMTHSLVWDLVIPLLLGATWFFIVILIVYGLAVILGSIIEGVHATREEGRMVNAATSISWLAVPALAILFLLPQSVPTGSRIALLGPILAVFGPAAYLLYKDHNRLSIRQIPGAVVEASIQTLAWMTTLLWLSLALLIPIVLLVLVVTMVIASFQSS